MPEDNDSAGSIFDPKMILQVNRQPIQRPGQDRLLSTATVGGPDLPGDRRVYLSTDLLARCLDVARTSATGRVLLDHAGVRVDLYEAKDGHRYEVWTLIGVGPKPEQLPDWAKGGG